MKNCLCPTANNTRRKYLDCVEFRNRKNQPFDWENEELGETLTEVEEPIYPDILAKIPGVVLESDFADTGDAVTTPAPPTYEERVASALSNLAFPKHTGVDEEFTGVYRPLTGLYNTKFSRLIPGTTQLEPNVAGLTPPPLVCRQIEVEDVVDDDESDDEIDESSHAPQVEVRNEDIVDEEEAEAPR